MRNDEGVAPVAFVLMAIGVLSVMDGAIKEASRGLATEHVVALRFGLGALLGLPLFLLFGNRPDWSSIRGNALRGLLAVGTGMTFFYALATLPLAEAIALSFTAPLFLALLSSLMLKEHVSLRMLAAMALGLVGVAVILVPKLDMARELDDRTMLGMAAALASALTYALSLVLLRRQAGRDAPITVVFLQQLFAGILASPALILAPPALDRDTLLLFLGIAVLGVIGHLGMALGYARASAARLGPLEYTSFFWAAVIGWVWFREPLEGPTIAGTAVIVIACALVVRAGPRRARPTVSTPMDPKDTIIHAEEDRPS